MIKVGQFAFHQNRPVAVKEIVLYPNGVSMNDWVLIEHCKEGKEGPTEWVLRSELKPFTVEIINEIHDFYNKKIGRLNRILGTINECARYADL
jgi:hypothetical protein